MLRPSNMRKENERAELAKAPRLTPAQRRILKLMAEGWELTSNKNRDHWTILFGGGNSYRREAVNPGTGGALVRQKLIEPAFTFGGGAVTWRLTDNGHVHAWVGKVMDRKGGRDV